MPTYKMMTLADFKSKVKNGDYTSAGGARKAIGKAKEWNDKDRDAARAFVSKHFGEEAPAKKTAARKPRSAKKTTKKATSKKTAAKKTTTKKASAKTAAPTGRKKTAKKAAKTSKKTTKKVATKRQPRARSASPTEEEHTLRERLTEYQDAVGVYKDAAETLKKCKSEGMSVSEGLKTCADGLTSLVKGMDQHIVQPLTSQEQRGAELFAKAAEITNGHQPSVTLPEPSSDVGVQAQGHTTPEASASFQPPTPSNGAGVVPPPLP